MTTLAEALTTRTKEEVLADHLAEAASDGLPSAGWQDASLPRTLFAIGAGEQSVSETTRALVTKGGFIDLAEDDAWVDLCGQYLYDESRSLGQRAQHTVVIRDAGGGGTSKTAGAISFRADNDTRFTNIAGFTVPAGGSVSVDIIAESTGRSYNVQPGDITEFLTPMPGYTVENEDLGSGTSVTVVGTDDESNASYILRCKSKFALIGEGEADGRWIYKIQKSAPTITRISIDNLNPNGPNSIDFYLANSSGPATSGELDDVEAGVVIPSGSGNVRFLAAPEQTVSLAGTVTGGKQSEILTALQALEDDAGFGVRLYVEKIRTTIMNCTGVLNVELTTPSESILTNGVITFNTDGLVFT